MDERQIVERPMPTAVREPFAVLWQEVVRINFRYHFFKQLYGTERAVALLNAQAPGFFAMNRDVWVESILLGLARVLDDANGSTSLRVLVSRMESNGPHRIVESLKAKLGDLLKLGEAVDAYRNKRIAHIDARFHESGGKEALPPLHVDTIEQLFDGIAELMNMVGVNVGHGSTVYGGDGAMSDGDTLIFALRKSARFDELFPDARERWEQLREGASAV